MKSFILKYKWWLSIVCCALLVACEPASTTSTQNPISFGAGRKNSAYKKDNLSETANAYLWGYRTYTENTTNETEIIFDGVEALLKDVNNDKSIYDDIEINDTEKYWNIGTYNFFSVSPKLNKDPNEQDKELVSVADNTLTIANFDIATQTDVIAAVPGIIEVDKLEHKDPVTLNYTHLFSKLKFQAKTTQGTCTITQFSITVPRYATYTHTTGVWTIATGDNNTQTLTFATGTPVNDDETYDPLDLDGPNGTNDNGWLIYPGTVIADDLATTDIKEGIPFSITYKVGNNEQNQTGTLPALTNGGLANNSYIYTLKIQPSGPIIFGGVTVSLWFEDTKNSQKLDFDTTKGQ